jgi:sialate O-acetylesterase
MKKQFLLISLFLLFVCNVFADVTLPKLINDGMVLQRDVNLKIWGWALPEERITISFRNKTFKTVTDKNGNWQLMLSPQKAGGPFTMNIKGKNNIVLNDILIGDVWLCAGQSNMEHQMSLHSVLYADEIANANYKEIRQFKIPNTLNYFNPQKDVAGGEWKWANEKDVMNFSAVAYFFAKTLYQKYKIPIGIINASWGGTPIQAWMSEESLKNFPAITAIIEKNKKKSDENPVVPAPLPPQKESDKGYLEHWEDPNYIPRNWRRIAVPGFWEDQGLRDLDGVVWYRKEINIPVSMLHTPAKIFLGRIVDADNLFINGHQVGITSYMYPQRRYAIPNGVLKEGKNLFVVRVTNNSGKGGFVPDKPYQLIAGKDTIDLTGYWEYKVGKINNPRSGTNFNNFIAQYQPTVLYNAMLAPVTNYSVRGFVWYQGESDTYQPSEYAKLQPAMINDWREKWGDEKLPFLFVQLPGFGDHNYLPSEKSGWALFRENQEKILEMVPYTGMAVTIDIGEWNDVHPDRKKEVGERLALNARKISYDEDVFHNGPMLHFFQEDNFLGSNGMMLSFNNVGGGLISNDGEELSDFAIAGADKKFVWANTKIIGENKIFVWSDDIPHPKYVRYAWADNPINPNLANKENLPAAPFRTDKDN